MLMVSKRRRAVLLFVCAGQFLIFFDRFLFAAVAPLVQRDLSLTDWQMGLLLGPAFALVFGGTAMLCGLLARQCGGHLLFTIGLVIWGAATIGIAFAWSFDTVVLARASLGIGQAIFMPIAVTLLVDAAPVARRGMVLALFTGASTTGRGISLLTAGAILSVLARAGALPGGVAGWRVLFVLTALPTLLLVVAAPLVLATLLRHQPGRRAHARAAEWVRWHRAPIVRSAIIAVAPVLAVQTLALWLPTLLGRAFPVPLGAISASLGGITLLTAPLGQAIGGQLVDRVAVWRDSPGRLVVVAMLLALPFVFLMATTDRFAIALLAIAILNLVLGVATIAGLIGVQALSPAAARGPINGYFLAFTTFVGIGLGPALAGLLSGAALGAGRLGIAVALVLVTVLAAAAAGIALLSGRGRFAAVAAEARRLA